MQLFPTDFQWGPCIFDLAAAGIFFFLKMQTSAAKDVNTSFLAAADRVALQQRKHELKLQDLVLFSGSCHVN